CFNRVVPNFLWKVDRCDGRPREGLIRIRGVCGGGDGNIIFDAALCNLPLTHFPLENVGFLCHLQEVLFALKSEPSMNFLHEIVYSHPLISVAQTIFMVGMAMDAYRRRAEQFWYWIIFFVPILGAWAYFFVV